MAVEVWTDGFCPACGNDLMDQVVPVGSDGRPLAVAEPVGELNRALLMGTNIKQSAACSGCDREILLGAGWLNQS